MSAQTPHERPDGRDDVDARAGADLALLKEAVLAAGRLAAQMQRDSLKRWRKKDGTLVSEADLAVDRLLSARLGKARPAYGWWSEESAFKAPERDAPTWIVDPIDGTRAYLAGRPDWCVAGALIADGRPLLAAVAEPAAGLLYWAARGLGAYCDGRRLQVSGRERLADARVFADPGRLADRRRWPAPWPAFTHLRLGSFILRLARIAAGKADLVISFTAKQPWDIAPGALLVEEAGGVLGTAAGPPPAYRRGRRIAAPFFAGGRPLAREVEARLKAASRLEGQA